MRSCDQCGAPVTRRITALTCSIACTQARSHRLERERPLQALPVRRCTECGHGFTPRRGNPVTCGGECSVARNRRLVRENARARRAAAVPAVQPEARPVEPPPEPPPAAVSPTGPYPTPCRRVYEAERVDREMDCTRYDDCLDVAALRGWDGFTCRDCPIRGTCSRALDVEAATYFGGISIAAQLAESRTEAQMVSALRREQALARRGARG